MLLLKGVFLALNVHTARCGLVAYVVIFAIMVFSTMKVSVSMEDALQDLRIMVLEDVSGLPQPPSVRLVSFCSMESVCRTVEVRISLIF